MSGITHIIALLMESSSESDQVPSNLLPDTLGLRFVVENLMSVIAEYDTDRDHRTMHTAPILMLVLAKVCQQTNSVWEKASRDALYLFFSAFVDKVEIAERVRNHTGSVLGLAVVLVA
jgi:hypothetical protein